MLGRVYPGGDSPLLWAVGLCSQARPRAGMVSQCHLCWVRTLSKLVGKRFEPSLETGHVSLPGKEDRKRTGRWSRGDRRVLWRGWEVTCTPGNCSSRAVGKMADEAQEAGLWLDRHIVVFFLLDAFCLAVMSQFPALWQKALGVIFVTSLSHCLATFFQLSWLLSKCYN